jgi:hypothetical protein
MSNKDEALGLIKELLGLNEVMFSESLADHIKLHMMRDRLEELQDVVNGIRGCQCNE